MTTNVLAYSFIVQASIVIAVAILMRANIPLRLNLLLSSAFITSPVWTYRPLADVGMLFLFDIVVPIVAAWSLYLHRFTVPAYPLKSIAILLVVMPLFFAPLGFYFLDEFFYDYHVVLLGNVYYRSLMIVAAVAVLVIEANMSNRVAVIRLMAIQFLVLFGLGVLQYAGNIDFVVYERLKDVENAIDALMTTTESVYYGFGFLGLFRGAIPQMAVIGLFWCLTVTNLRDRISRKGLLLLIFCLTAVVCVAGSLSRIGLAAFILALAYAFTVTSVLRRWAFIVIPVTVGVLIASGYWVALEGLTADVMGDRFSVEELTGREGSGSTRISSAKQFGNDLMVNPWLWWTGLGGFNPIATNEYFGVFGMHGDYLDVLVRYGVIPGLVFGAMVLLLMTRALAGYFSHLAFRRELSRSFGAIYVGVPVLGLTQGALIFSGTAGYLAAAHAWLAIAFAVFHQFHDNAAG